jgi:hypothetical protein
MKRRKSAVTVGSATDVAIEALNGWFLEIETRLDHAGVPVRFSDDDDRSLKTIVILRSLLGPGPDRVAAGVEALRAVSRSLRPSRRQLDRAGLCYHIECLDRGDPTPTTLLRR